MAGLNYNIYSNISDKSFIAIAEKLMSVEADMLEILKHGGWWLHSPVANSDALAVDFVKTNSMLSGNLGIKFEDTPKKVTFTFYVTKSFDENQYRYFLREAIFSNKGFDFFENKIAEFTNLALQKYNSWDKDDIVKLGTRSKLGPDAWLDFIK